MFMLILPVTAITARVEEDMEGEKTCYCMGGRKEVIRELIACPICGPVSIPVPSLTCF